MVFISLGNVVFLAGVFWRLTRLQQSREAALGVGLSLLFVAAFAARAFYGVLHGLPPTEYLSPLSAHRGGFSFFGACLGASLFALALASAWKPASRPPGMIGEIVPIWCVAAIVWRMGCHVAGCCHGPAIDNQFILTLNNALGSGAPDLLPLPLLEMCFWLSAAIVLGPVLPMQRSFLRLAPAQIEKIRLISLVLGYPLFRLTTHLLCR